MEIQKQNKWYLGSGFIIRPEINKFIYTKIYWKDKYEETLQVLKRTPILEKGDAKRGLKWRKP